MGKKRRMYPHFLNLKIFAKRTPQKVLKANNLFFERRPRFRNRTQIRFQQSRYPIPWMGGKWKLDCDKGFVTLSLIWLAPFIFLLASGTLWMIWFINQKHQLDNICYEYVMKSQKALIDQNQKLMKLNALAKLLISEKKILNKLILTGTPEIKAAAQLKKLQVIAQQKALKLQQNVLFRLGESLSRVELFRLKKKMNRRFGKISRIWSKSRIQFLRFRVQWKPSQLQVKIRDIAPSTKGETITPEIRPIKFNGVCP